MQKHEAAITNRINKWFAPIVPQSSPWEVKHTRGSKTFKLREIDEHQKDYLLAATTETGFTYKIPDIGLSHPPCDVIHYKNTPAYIIVAFPSMTYVLEIRDVLSHSKTVMKEETAALLSLWSCPNSKLPT